MKTKVKPFTLPDPILDDEDLEELQEMLWRTGYLPEPYIRHDWYVWESALLDTRRYRPRKPKAPAPLKSKFAPGDEPKVVPQYSVFECDGCHQQFRSITDDLTAEVEYQETFGENATDDRLALCEGCYNRMMQDYHATEN
jgi:hypothetical protein